MSSLEKLRACAPQIAQQAQLIYDDWQQDKDGVDENLGTGGICDLIAEIISQTLHDHLVDIDTDVNGQESDDHASTLVTIDGEKYDVDIPCHYYERGSGYRWTKKPNVIFTSDMIEITPI